MKQSDKDQHGISSNGIDPAITADEFILELATTSADRYAQGEDRFGDYHVPNSRAFARPAGDDRPPRPPQPGAATRAAGTPPIPPEAVLRLPEREE